MYALVRDFFMEEEGDAILSLPHCIAKSDDRLLWHFNISGEYSVHSRYWLALSSHSCPSGSGLNASDSWWKFLWRLNIPSKI